jgi:hypothetical protein
VIAPASTGSESNNKNAVTNTVQINKGLIFKKTPRLFMLNADTIKLIAPAIELTPAKCRAKILKSTELPE